MHTCHNSARSLQPLTDMASNLEYMIDEARNCALPANLIDNTSAIELLFAQWTSRLSRIGDMDADTAAKMKGALVDNGIPWSASQRRELEHLISVSDAPTTERRGKMQKALNFENLLSQNDWAKLRSGKIEHVKVALLAHRAATLNIKNASEATLFRMTDIIAYCSDQAQYDQTKKSRMKITLQDSIKSCHAELKKQRDHQSQQDVPWITNYPFSASDLPEELIALAYGDAGPPVEVDIPELNLKDDTKMRPKRQSAPTWLKTVPLEHRHLFFKSPSTSQEVGAPEKPRSYTKPVEDDEPSIPIGSLDLPIGAQLFGKRSPMTMPPSAKVMPAAGARKPVVKIEISDSPPPKKPRHDSGTVEEMEAMLVDASKERGASKSAAAKKTSSACAKKPAAACAKNPPAAKSAAAKKPAAPKAKQLMKKPSARVAAAPSVNMKDVFDTLRASRNSKSRGAFTSFAYKKGEHRMIRAGGTTEQSKEFARRMLAKASEMWTSLS